MVQAETTSGASYRDWVKKRRGKRLGRDGGAQQSEEGGSIGLSRLQEANFTGL